MKNMSIRKGVELENKSKTYKHLVLIKTKPVSMSYAVVKKILEMNWSIVIKTDWFHYFNNVDAINTTLVIRK